MKKLVLVSLFSIGVARLASAGSVTCAVQMNPNTSGNTGGVCSVAADPGFFIDSLTLSGTDNYTGSLSGTPTVIYGATLTQSTPVFSAPTFCAGGTGSLPCAITINPRARVAGLNLATYSVQLTNAGNVVTGGQIGGGTITLNLSFTETANPAPTFSCTNNGAPLQVGVSYTTSCTATAGTGTPPYTWSIVSGSLPAGITLSGTSGTSVTISGTPTTAGAARYSLQLADSPNLQATESFSGTIAPAPLVINKAFAPSKISPNATSTLTFTITNPDPQVAQTSVAFTDTFPAGMVLATPLSLSTTCGGPATATTGSAILTNGTLAGGASCTFSVNVAGSAGTYLNSVTVSSTNGGTGNTAFDTLTIVSPAVLTENFGVVSMGVGGTTSLTFTLTNPNQSVTLTGIEFSDPPPGLVVATPNRLTGSCQPGIITAIAGSNSITLGSPGATLAPLSSCKFSVNVTANGIVPGLIAAGTSPVTSNEAPNGAGAAATIFIGYPLQVSYAANLNIGESYIAIANEGTNGALPLGPGFGAALGNICVNVYAVDAGEELISCCSCLITPDQTVHLGINKDLAAKSLSGMTETSVTVKLLATLAGGDGTGTSCNNTAATTASAALANGMAAWSTRLHTTPAGGIALPAGGYATTETPFTGATLSASELAGVGSRCANVLGNDGGFGICNSCRFGPTGLGRVPN